MKLLKNSLTFFLKYTYNLINLLHMDTIIYNFFFLHVPIKFFFYFNSSYSGYLKEYIPQEGDIVIEGGAYTGNFTILLSRLVGKSGKVFAIEANPKICSILKNRLKRLKINNVIVINRGLWDNTNNIKLPINEQTRKKGFSIATSSAEKNAESLILQNITIDTLIQKYNITRLNYIAMDVEGAEIEALKGAKNTLKKFNVHLAIASYHYRDGKQTYTTVEKILKKYGYETYTDNPIHLTTYGLPTSKTPYSKE